MFFRGNPNYNVACFTAAQISGIAGRRYPRALAGRLYPKGIPIFPEEQLPALIKKFKAGVVVLAYSDLPHMHVMHVASLALACGADFWLMGPESTMLKPGKPVISVTAVRTGCGKSQTTRAICRVLKGEGYRVVAIRHPMPYGDLSRQVCQRFETYGDLDKQKCTIEEREEYEPLIDAGVVVFAGVDYEKILRAAEKEADIIVFDGGNNDFPFIRSGLRIVIADPHRPGHEITYHPGETNLRMADIVVINKERSAHEKNIEAVRANTRKYNPAARIIDADSEITASDPKAIEGRRALVVEDGPTLTHGGMAYGAGAIAAQRHGCTAIDPRPFAVGSIRKVFENFRHIGNVLPAMGYSSRQVGELRQTINSADCDVVISATPIDLRRLLKVSKPVVRIGYELDSRSMEELHSVVRRFARSSTKRH